jgi:uncharacterized SAM-binding protein YcdF (DUF218 family)
LIYLHKLLPIFFSPIFIVIILLIIGLKKKKFIYINLIFLTITSLPISIKLIDSLIFNDDTTINYNDKNLDAIIILSGMLKVVKNNNGNYYEWGESSDRFFNGIELAKKFPNLPIIFTSGLLPWSNISVTEGEFLANFAIENFNIDKSRILKTNIVKNTLEEASEISRINNIKNILLVTSYIHMPRAKLIFKKHDFNVFPVKVDRLVSNYNTTLIDFFPSAQSYLIFNQYIRELLGYCYYQIYFWFKS